MAINIPATLLTVDRTLIAQGLYTPATFLEEVISGTATYDPVTGDYTTGKTSTAHEFNVVVLDTSYNSQDDNMYNVTTNIMILPQNIIFAPDIDQIYTIGGRDWHVSQIKLSSQNSLWEMTLGRK